MAQIATSLYESPFEQTIIEIMWDDVTLRATQIVLTAPFTMPYGPLHYWLLYQGRLLEGVWRAPNPQNPKNTVNINPPAVVVLGTDPNKGTPVVRFTGLDGFGAGYDGSSPSS